MITEKGTLIVGIEYENKVHRDFELRPQLVRDSIEAIEDDRARRNENYLGLCIIAKQLIKLGEIPKEKITPELIMDMHEVDLTVIFDATRRLQKRLNSFRKQDETHKEAFLGNAETGV